MKQSWDCFGHCPRNDENNLGIEMNILITGGTGFIGQTLCPYLEKLGNSIFVLTRNIQKGKKKLPPTITLVDKLSEQLLFKMDAVINLAGAPIGKRWTTSYKQEIMASRLSITEQLIHLIESMDKKPLVFISGSAIGYYGPQADVPLTEDAPSVASFSHELCAAWENAARKAAAMGVRTCLIRTGLILGKSGGVLAPIRRQFLLGLGGKIGSGKQWMSWCHIEDYIRIIEFCLLDERVQGPINATSPHPVTNVEFSQTLAKVLHRPCWFKMPSFLIKLLFGQMGYELLLSGQRVIPKKILGLGFSFQYPRLMDALMQIEQDKRPE